MQNLSKQSGTAILLSGGNEALVTYTLETFRAGASISGRGTLKGDNAVLYKAIMESYSDIVFSPGRSTRILVTQVFGNGNAEFVFAGDFYED